MNNQSTAPGTPDSTEVRSVRFITVQDIIDSTREYGSSMEPMQLPALPKKKNMDCTWVPLKKFKLE
jgi:hypothetical protein